MPQLQFKWYFRKTYSANLYRFRVGGLRRAFVLNFGYYQLFIGW